MGAFQQRADSLEHLAWGQIFKGISPGGRKIGAPFQGAYGWGHFTRGQIAWNTFPGGRYLGAFHQGAKKLEHLARGQIAGVWFNLSKEEKYMWYF